jgi:hypothetical protein
VGEFACSTGRELGDSLLNAAHRFHLLFDAFGDLGLLAGHLDSQLSNAVAGDRDWRRDARRKRSPEARDRYRLPLVQPRRDRGSGCSCDRAAAHLGVPTRASAVVLVAIVTT